MAIFNDLAVELQEAIWDLVLPASRGVHWVEVEGIPHDPEFIRDSVRMTQWYRFDRMPETFDQVYNERGSNPEFQVRARKTTEESSPFFRRLLTTVPTVFGQSGSDDDCEELHHDLLPDLYTSLNLLAITQRRAAVYPGQLQQIQLAHPPQHRPALPAALDGRLGGTVQQRQVSGNPAKR
jgi:hypothetical protein